MTEYRMFSDEALSKFRSFAAAAGINQHHPQGAFDVKPKFSRDATPVDDMVKLIGSLLADNAKLRHGMATDAVLAASSPTTTPTEPFDDITDDLAKLKSTLAAYMPPNVFDEAKETIEEAIRRVSELVKVAHAAMNKSKLADDGDEPPDFPGKPQRGGEPAMDSALRKSMARIGTDGAARDEDALERLRANLSRIGNA